MSEEIKDQQNIIKEIVHNSKFQTAQMDFQKKNNVQDLDENSHETFKIFKEFESVTENLIVIKVLEKQPNFKIDQFFKDLSQHSEIQKDDDTFEILSDFLDFETFKKNVINNSENKEKDKNITVKESLEQESFDDLVKLMKEDKTVANGWKLTSKDEGPLTITVQEKESEQKSKLWCTTGQMKGLDLNKTMEGLADIKSPAWEMEGMENVEWVDEPAKIFRMEMKMPFFSKREIIAQLEVDRSNNRILMKSVKSDKHPVTSSQVRAQMVDCMELTEVNGSLKLVEMSSFDMGGWMPSSMMNMLAGSMISTEYNKMYEKFKRIQGIKD